MAGNHESIEIFPGENGGHRVVRNLKREAGKKSGSMAGGVYMERPNRNARDTGQIAGRDCGTASH